MSENINIDSLINDLQDHLAMVHLGEKEVPESELVSLVLKIFRTMTKEYATYRRCIAKVLWILEEYRTTSMIVLIDSFFFLFNQLIVKKDVSEIDDSLLKTRYVDDIDKKFLLALKQSITEGAQIRISDFNFYKFNLSNDDKKGIISLLVDYLQNSTEILIWDDERIQEVMLELAVIRNLLNEQNDHTSFYYLSAMIMDRFSSSEFHQQSRDLAEEIIISSYIDKNSYLGYFNSFRCYSNNSSAVPGVLYACLSITNAFESGTIISSKYVKEIIWQGIKYFRNISLHYWVHFIYESIPNHISFSPYEKRSITHSYFTSLLMLKEKKLPNLLLDFLNGNREEIYQGGIHDALPWLMTLYNVRRIYPEADFSATGLGNYIATFEMIVPEEIVLNRRAMIEGDVNKLKPMLRESLVKLNETRNSSDMVNDNNMAMKIASRLVDQAVNNNDYEALLLAMMIKSDFSFVFSDKKRQEITPLNIPDTSIESFEKIYGSEIETMRKLDAQRNRAIVWIISTENRCFQLSYMGKNFRCIQIEDWNLGKFQGLVRSGFFSQFSFDDTIKTKNEVRAVFPEEHIEQSNRYKEKFNFFKLDLSEDSWPILVVMDMALAGFPHNLLLSLEGDLLHFKSPIANILSTEWYIQYSNQDKIAKQFPKSIWIPTEGGDLTLNNLFRKLEDSLLGNNFNIFQSIEPESPINNDLNIICSHGSRNIALKQVIFPDKKPRLNLDKYLGSGKILIFFVCHSGSISSTPFENSISSIVKRYIAAGYKSVIAPFWELHINIPPIWLPVFLKSIEQGSSIIHAVHQANLAVQEVYPTLSAWCCLHLYGDPHIQLAE